MHQFVQSSRRLLSACYLRWCWLWGKKALTIYFIWAQYAENACMYGGQMNMAEEGWYKLGWKILWSAMFVTSAIANEIAWRSLSTDGWVNYFKEAFGLTGISLLFAVASSFSSMLTIFSLFSPDIPKI